MWTSSQTKAAALSARHDAELGTVTASGHEVSAYLNGEKRWMPVMAPGGYRWRPAVGEQVLILKTGAQSEGACVLGCQAESREELAPGEIELTGPECRLKMTREGDVEIHGTVKINGVALEDLIRGTVASTLMPALLTEG